MYTNQLIFTLNNLMKFSIITAKCNSKRLKNKILKKINSRNRAIDILIARARHIGLPIILATSNSKNDDKLVKYVLNKYQNIKIFRGSENNKLKRWYDCFTKYKIKKACMIDGDDLCFCYDMYKKAMNKIGQNDLIKYPNNLIPGLFTFVIKKKALIKTKKYFIKKTKTEMAEIFFEKAKIKNKTLKVKKIFLKKNIRLTLDYIEDLRLFKKIYKLFSNNEKSIKVLNFLIKKPNLCKINFFRNIQWKRKQELEKITF